MLIESILPPSSSNPIEADDIAAKGGVEPSRFNNRLTGEQVLALGDLDEQLALTDLAVAIDSGLKSSLPYLCESVEGILEKNPGLRSRLLTSLLSETAADLLAKPKPGQFLIVAANATDGYSPKNLNDTAGYEVADRAITLRHSALRQANTGFAQPVLETYNTDVYVSEERWKKGALQMLRLRSQSMGHGDVFDLENELQAQTLASSEKCIQGAEKILTQQMAHLILNMPDNTRPGFLEFQRRIRSGIKYKFGVGAAIIGESFAHDKPEDRLHLREAYSKATSVARSIQSKEPGVNVFSVENFSKILGQISQERDSLIAEGNTITLKNGKSWKIFDSKLGSQGENIYTINPDVLRSIRKNDLQSDDEITIARIRRYLKHINVIDSPMFYTASEIQGSVGMRGNPQKTLATHLDQASKVGDLITNKLPLNRNDLNVVKKVLLQDPRDPVYTSRAAFHAKALEMPNKVYLNIDALDLGLEVVNEYELSLQRLQREIDSGNDLSAILPRFMLTAGDSITLKMRNFRDKVQQILLSDGIPNDQIANFLGGDEETVVINADCFLNQSSKFDSERFDTLLAMIRLQIHGRVIALTSFDSADPLVMSSVDKKLKHLNNMSELDIGTTKSKSIEKGFISKTQLFGQEINEAKKLLQSLGSDGFIIQKNQDGEWVMLDINGKERKVEEVEKRVAEIE
jgi:hypothetical protein